MKLASPFRYPGGKAALADVLAQVRRLNGVSGHSFAEPFGGGAGAALTLLFREETPKIHINDADPAIHAFWWSALTRSRAFLRLLGEKRVSMAEWRRQRRIYLSKSKSKLGRGFAAFYLNRCNRSGIIKDGGPIGGVDQEGPWKLGARFNKRTLGDRLAKIAEYRDRITAHCSDGIQFVRLLGSAGSFYFLDPPYYGKGRTLYLNDLDESYHATLAEELRYRVTAPWVMTYDDCTEIRRLYRGWANIRAFSLRYVASERRVGREILISPKWLQLPKTQSSGAVVW